MKRIAVYLTISHIAFTCGLAASSLWNETKLKPKTELIDTNVLKRAPAPLPLPPPPAVVTSMSLVQPHSEIVFGHHGLRIVPHQIRLKSARLHYEIDVSYPEIVGTNDPHIQKINLLIKNLAAEQYQWAINLSEGDLRYYQDHHQEVFNSVNLDYEITEATDRLVSIYFIGHNYSFDGAHAGQYTFTLNYNLTPR